MRYYALDMNRTEDMGLKLVTSESHDYGWFPTKTQAISNYIRILINDSNSVIRQIERHSHADNLSLNTIRYWVQELEYCLEEFDQIKTLRNFIGPIESAAS